MGKMDPRFYWYCKPYDYFMTVNGRVYANLDVGSNQRVNTNYWWRKINYWNELKEEVRLEETTATEIHKVITKEIHNRVLGKLEW